MAPLNRSSSSSSSIIHHFSHPKHALKLLNIPHEFFCNGCSVLGGAGPRYHCKTCDFDLHELCATCPATTLSAVHRHHLTLVNQPVYDTCCDLCGDLVHGLFYTCAACKFDVHPLCTRLPLRIQLLNHPEYLLKLQPGGPASCALCYEPCTSWRYKCDKASLDIHLECALGDCDDNVSQPTAACQMRTAVPPLQQAAVGGCAVGIPIGGGYGPYGTPGNTPKSGRSKKRRMFCFLGRIAASAVITAVIGLPFGI